MRKIVKQSIACILLVGIYTAASNSNIDVLKRGAAEVHEKLVKEYTHTELKQFGRTAVSAIRNIPTAMVKINETMAHGSDYGEPIDEISSSEKFAVYATAGGTVREIGINEDIGKYIVLQHGDRSESIYGNLSNVTCLLNEKVRKGEIIGEYTQNPEKNFYYTLNYFD